MKLNKYQAKALEADIKLNKFILANPGSGKTTLMVEQYVKLVNDHGINPNSIAVVTFSRKAANEILNRIRRKINLLPATAEAKICTIHAFCKRLLESEIKGYSKTIWKRHTHMNKCDNPEFWLKIRSGKVFDELGLHDESRPSEFDVETYISFRLASIIYDHSAFVAYSSVDQAHALDKVYSDYLGYMKENNLTTFDIIISEVEYRIMNTTPLRIRTQFENSYIIMDECQDTFHQPARIMTTISQEPGWNEIYSKMKREV